MVPHKFGIGARVTYRGPHDRQPIMAGDFIVSRIAPADEQGNQYWIESPDGHRRLAHEAQLARRERRLPPRR